jgi:hypothetical protein
MLGELPRFVSLEGLIGSKQQCQTKVPCHPGMTKALLMAYQPRNAVLSLIASTVGLDRHIAYAFDNNNQYFIALPIQLDTQARTPRGDRPMTCRDRSARTGPGGVNDCAAPLEWPIKLTLYRLEVSPAIPSLR